MPLLADNHYDDCRYVRSLWSRRPNAFRKWWCLHVSTSPGLGHYNGPSSALHLLQAECLSLVNSIRTIVLAACLLALAPFEGFGFVDPFDDGGVQAREDGADFGGAGAEEFAAQVDQVEAPVGEL